MNLPTLTVKNAPVSSNHDLSRLFRTAAGILFAAIALGGCQTKPVSEMTYTELRSLADELVYRCIAQGVSASEMNTCTQQEARREVAMRGQNRQANEEFGEGLQQIGRGMMDPRYR